MPVIRISPKQIGPELKARARRTPKELQKAMKRSAMRAQAVLTRRTPKDQGRAKAGWRISQPIEGANGARIDLYNDAPYIGILELGARPHPVSLEGRIAIYEWVLRNIPPAPVSGPVRAPKYKTGGRRAFQKSSTEAVAMEITNAIVWKLRTKGQKGTFFVKRSMPELQQDFAVQLQNQLEAYSRQRAAKEGPQ